MAHGFLRLFLALLAFGLAAPAVAGTFNEVAFPHWADARTGVTVYNLTPGEAKDQIIYQTHPMWSPGMGHLLFQSERSGDGLRPHVVRMDTGEIRPLLPHSAGGALSPSSGRYYYLVDRNLFRIPLAAAFDNTLAPERVADLPAAIVATVGGLSVGADEKSLYCGASLDNATRHAVYALNLEAGTWRELGVVDFKVGHVQAAPVAGSGVSFCQESGGDTAQRMWYVAEDGRAPRPFFKEQHEEWVTHEVWWGAGRMLFTVWPYDDAHKAQPHGIFAHTLGAGAPEIFAQYPAWHTAGSPDGQWILGDDHDRSLWLIRAATRVRRLLTTGHATGPWKTHPHASFTPDSKAILLNSSHQGNDDVLLVKIPDSFESLPLP